MAYVDLTTSFVYKSLLTYQLCTSLATNDKLFNDELTGAISIPNDVKLGNARALRGEVVATGTWRTLAQLDASNIVQIGDAACETRVPADPTNVLGIATKQYVDGVQMFHTQPKVTVTSGSAGAFVTVLSLTATTRGHLLAITGKADATGNDACRLRITIDGGTPVTIISTTNPAANKWRGLTPPLVWSTVDQATEDLAAYLLNISFNSSILVEAAYNNGAATYACSVLYDKI
jgi:hypothetical protein